MDQHQQFLELFLRHQHDLTAFVASVVRDWHRAQDILQELAVILWEKFDDYDRSRSFGAWARGIAHHLIQRDYERFRRSLPLLSPEAIAALLVAYDQEDVGTSSELEALRNCMGQLSERSKILLRLRYEEELSIESCADRIAGTAVAVKKALTRIRAQLHRCVDQRLGRGSGLQASS